MVRIEEIRKAIIELPVEELRIYLEEAIFNGIEEDSPEEEALFKIRDEAMEPFLYGCDNLEIRPMYDKLNEVAGIKTYDELPDEEKVVILPFEKAKQRYPHIFQEGDKSSLDPWVRKRKLANPDWDWPWRKKDLDD